MNEDLIKRSDAIRVASKECHEFRGIFGRIEEGIKELPSADRSQAEWIDKGNWMGIECSRCKCHSRYVTPFCPQCGARMKGADDA